MSTHTPPHVKRDMTLVHVLESGSQNIRACFTYDIKDPYAVSITFMDEDDTDNTWRMARDLLQRGQKKKVGEGDVVVCPSPRKLGKNIELAVHAPNGDAQFDIPLRPLVNFLRSTYKLVPAGKESTYMSSEIDEAIQRIRGLQA